MKMLERPTFQVRLDKDGQPWIAIEKGPQEGQVTNGLYGFHLAPGTSQEEAEKIARYLGEKLEYFVKL
ncbi:hypothetical protein ACIOVF_24265 [Pseudomonas sp. NPDC087612]|uniref:hypothetical protein n=1 Tax=Pseudomonas sp. NPDC087612 TaxID=3364441 RepID=UPI00381979A7